MIKSNNTYINININIYIYSQMLLAAPWFKQSFAEDTRIVLPAQWKPDVASQNCEICAKPFEFFRRRHHCRLCGGLFCHSCSNVFLPIEPLLRLLLELNNRERNKLGGLSQVMWPEKKQNNTTSNGNLRGARNNKTFVSTTKTTVLQRVCTQCYKTVHSYPIIHRSGQTSLGKYIDKLKKENHSTQLESCSDARVPVVCTRERKICVIILQEGTLVENRKCTDLAALFTALERLITSDASGTETIASAPTSNKDCDLSPGPSLSSASDHFASEKNVFDTCGNQSLVATTRAPKKLQDVRGRTLINAAVAHKRKKLFVQVSVPLQLVAAYAGVNVNVPAQLVGVCYRHGSDRELLQQYTIGTDAYIIFVDGQFVSSPFCGVAATGAAVDSSVVNSSAPPLLLLSPSDVRRSAAAGKLPESVRGVLGAVGRYSGNTPICAVVHRGHCDAADCGKLPAAAFSGRNRFYRGRQPAGAVRGVTAEAQPVALHRALCSVIADVIQRDALRQEE